MCRIVHVRMRNIYLLCLGKCHVEMCSPYFNFVSSIRVKTFANFAVWGQFAKVLTAKIFIEHGGVNINRRVIVVSHKSRKF